MCLEDSCFFTDLGEEVYMDPQSKFNIGKKKNVKLRKALYDLKQAPKAWYERFSNVMISLGFWSCYTDNALFVKNTGTNIMIFLLYIDDMIITRSDKKRVNQIKNVYLIWVF
jgi:N-acetylneuraminic acid mutarotase